MRKNPNARSGLFNQRAVLAFGLCLIGLPLALVSFVGQIRSNTRPGAAPLGCVVIPGYNDACPTWVQTYDFPGGHGVIGWGDSAIAMVASPSCDRLYVTGE